AAPPGTELIDRTRRTGTGASGEIRVHSPATYSSTMTSPTTTIRTPRNDDVRTSSHSVSDPRSLIVGLRHVQQIPPVRRVTKCLGPLDELLAIDPAHPVGNLFRAGDLQALARLQGLHKGRGLQQR